MIGLVDDITCLKADVRGEVFADKNVNEDKLFEVSGLDENVADIDFGGRIDALAWIKSIWDAICDWGCNKYEEQVGMNESIGSGKHFSSDTEGRDGLYGDGLRT